MAETWDLRMNLPQLSSGLRFPFEFVPLSPGRAEHPCSAAANQGWLALPETTRTARGAVPTSHLPFPAFPPPYLYLHPMTSRRLILAYFVLVLIAMTWVSWYACVTPSISSLPEYAGKGLNVIGGYVTVCSEPWGLATMFDAYFGFLAFWLYVAWREQTVTSRLSWFVALMLLGNFAIAAYALLCLFKAKGETDLGKVFFTRKVA